MNRAGKLVVPTQFAASRDFYEGLAAVKVQGKWGFIGEDGRILVDTKFEDVQDFDAGFAGVKTNGLWGFIDRTGRFVLSPQFHDIHSFHNGSPPVVIRSDGYWQYLDESRSSLSGTVTNVPCGLSNGMALFRSLDAKYGFVDTHGQWVIPPQFEQAGCFSDDRAVVEVGGKWGVIDTVGQFVFPPQFDDISPFTEGVAIVDVGPKEGIIRADGSWLLLPRYNFIGLMSESRVSFGDVHSGWKRGFLDETGNVVVDIQFNKALEFRGGLARVETDEGTGYIDRDGTYVWKPTR